MKMTKNRLEVFLVSWESVTIYIFWNGKNVHFPNVGTYLQKRWSKHEKIRGCVFTNSKNISNTYPSIGKTKFSILTFFLWDTSYFHVQLLSVWIFHIAWGVQLWIFDVDLGDFWMKIYMWCTYHSRPYNLFQIFFVEFRGVRTTFEKLLNVWDWCWLLCLKIRTKEYRNNTGNKKL